jgi:hypothetical protein
VLSEHFTVAFVYYGLQDTLLIPRTWPFYFYFNAGVLRSPVIISIGILLLFSNCAVSVQSSPIGVRTTAVMSKTPLSAHSLCIIFCAVLTVISDCLHLSTINWLVFVMTMNCVLPERHELLLLGAVHSGFEALKSETINQPTTKIYLLLLSYKKLSCYFCLFFITSSLLTCPSSCFVPSCHCVFFW